MNRFSIVPWQPAPHPCRPDNRTQALAVRLIVDRSDAPRLQRSAGVDKLAWIGERFDDLKRQNHVENLCSAANLRRDVANQSQFAPPMALATSILSGCSARSPRPKAASDR